MDTNLAAFLLSAAIVWAVAFPLGKQLRRNPSVFYLAVVAVTGLYLWAIGTGARLTAVRVLAVVMQKGYLASLMLAVVMFTGCLDEGTALRRRLQPIRGELSILSFIFILGHLATYLPTYLGKLGAVFSARPGIAFSFVAACVLTVLFGVLAAMSLRVVRRNMDARRWKMVQRVSYVMVALLALHVLLALWRPAVVAHAARSMASLVAYAAVIALYAALRVRKALRDRGKAAGRAADGQQANG